ncbi:hypothetical protein ACG7TL_005600 [Trametes sanguinea]
MSGTDNKPDMLSGMLTGACNLSLGSEGYLNKAVHKLSTPLNLGSPRIQLHNTSGVTAGPNPSARPLIHDEHQDRSPPSTPNLQGLQKAVLVSIPRARGDAADTLSWCAWPS